MGMSGKTPPLQFELPGARSVASKPPDQKDPANVRRLNRRDSVSERSLTCNMAGHPARNKVSRRW